MAKSNRRNNKAFMVPEDESRDSHTYSFVYPKTNSFTKKGEKLRMRKYHPGRREHVWFVEVRMPPHSK